MTVYYRRRSPTWVNKLLVACEKGDTETVLAIRPHVLGAGVDYRNEEGECALFIAAKHGALNVVDILLRLYGAKVNERNGRRCWSALMAACHNQHHVVAQTLLEHGAKVDMKEINGLSALMVAAKGNHIEIVKLLLEYGANVNLQNNDGWSALMICSQNKTVELPKVLLEQNARVNEKDKRGWSALMIASFNGYTEVAELLLQYGANLNEKNDDGSSALMIAVQNGHSNMAYLLIDYRAEPEEEPSIATNSSDDSGYASGQFITPFRRDKESSKESIYMPIKCGKLTQANIYNNPYNYQTELIPPPLPPKKRSFKSKGIPQVRSLLLLPPLPPKKRSFKSKGDNSRDESEVEIKSPIPPMRKASLKIKGEKLTVNDHESQSPPPVPIKKRALIKIKAQKANLTLTATPAITVETTDITTESECVPPPLPPKKRASVKIKGDIHNKIDVTPPQMQPGVRTLISVAADCVQQSTWFHEAQKKAQVPFLHHQVFECDYDGMEHTIEEHDITLRIPEGAVTKGEKIHIEIGVVMYGPFAFPENTRPISPILWLCFVNKDIALKKDFQIILPHFLTGLTTEELHYHQVGFVKANHNQKYACTSKNGQIVYEFEVCETQTLFASSGGKSYGILKSDHCCFYCLQAKQTPELARNVGYCLARIESLSSEIFFVTSFFLKSCVKAWKEQFPDDEGYRLSRCVDFKFKRGESIEPHIKILPQKQDRFDVALDPHGAEIRASEIDFWKEDLNLETMYLKHNMKMYPPRVKMTVMTKSRDYIILPVKITGCSREGQLDMDLTIGLQSQSPSSSSTASGSLSALLENHSKDISTQENKPKLREIYRQLYPLATKWKDIGTLLGISKPLVDKISSEQERVHECLQEMLSEWLKQIDPSPTWKELIDTLEVVDPAKAKEIADSLAQT